LLRPLCCRCSTFRPIPVRAAPSEPGLVGDHHAWRAGWLADELAQSTVKGHSAGEGEWSRTSVLESASRLTTGPPVRTSRYQM
jgi:hypothetical protein